MEVKQTLALQSPASNKEEPILGQQVPQWALVMLQDLSKYVENAESISRQAVVQMLQGLQIPPAVPSPSELAPSLVVPAAPQQALYHEAWCEL